MLSGYRYFGGEGGRYFQIPKFVCKRKEMGVTHRNV